MGRSVDERIVRMEFDNAKFESNAKHTLTTLEKLKESLNFKDSAKSLNGLSDAAGKVNLNPLTNGVELVGQKFSAMETIAVGALLKIGSQAVTAGEQLVKSMSLDQIEAGWDKFAKKTTSVGTLISQGFDMSVVENQLERLSWFTDETSYNFTDMVENISKFTATGKGLTESVTAMEGIALWAAMSGQNAQKASQAMYQLSQAMSKGVLKYDDWKSIANASMDTKQFRENAASAAVELGVLKKVGDDTFKTLQGKVLSLNDLFSSEYMSKQAWFTSDVMMKVFKSYSSATGPVKDVADEFDILTSQVLKAAIASKEGDEDFEKFANTLVESGDITEKQKNALKDAVSQLDEFGVKALKAGQEARTFTDVIDSVKDAVSSKWMGIFENIIGNYEEAVEFYTDLSEKLWDLFAGGLDAKNELLSAWKDLGGRDDLIEAFWSVFKSIERITDLTKDLISEIFPPKSAEQLYKVTKGVSDFVKELKISEDTVNDLKYVLQIITVPLRAIVSTMETFGSKVLPSLLSTAKGFVSMLISLGKVVTYTALTFANLIVGTKEFDSIMKSLRTIVRSSVQIIKNFGRAIGSIFSAFNINGINLVDRFVSLILKLSDISLSAISKGLEYIANLNFSKVSDFPATISNGLKQIGNSKIVTTVTTGLKTILGFIIQLGSGIKDFFVNLFSKLKNIHSFNDLITLVVESFTKFKDTLFGMFENTNFGPWFDEVVSKCKGFVKGLLDALKELPKGEIIIWGFAIVLGMSLLRITETFEKFGYMATSFKGVADTLNGSLKRILGYTKYAAVLKEMTVFTATLALSIKLLSTIKGKDLLNASLALGILGAVFMTFAVVLSRIQGQSIVAQVALGKIVSACIAMSLSLAALAGSLWILSKIVVDFKQILPTLGAFGILLVEFAGTVLLISQTSKIFGASAIKLIALAGSVYILAKSIELIANLHVSNIYDVGKSLAAALAGMALVGLAAGRVKVTTFLGVILTAKSIKELVPSLKELSGLKLSEDAKRILDTIVEITKIIAGLAIIISIVKTLSNFTSAANKLQQPFKGLRNIASSFLMISASVILMTYAIHNIVNTLEELKDNPNALTNIVIATGIVAGLFALIMFMSRNARGSKSTKSEMLKFAGTLIVIASVVTILSLVIGLIGKLPQDELIKGGAVVGGLMALIAGLMVASQFAAKVKMGVILSFTAMLGVMVASLMVVSYAMDALGNGVWASLGFMAVALVELITALAIISKTTRKAKMGPIIAMTAMLAVAFGGLAALTLVIGEDKLIVLGAIVASLFVIMEALAHVGHQAKNVNLAPLLGLSAMLVAVGASLALVLLTGSDWLSMLVAAVALSGVILAVAGAAKLAGAVDAVGMIELALAVGIIAGSLALLTLVSWQDLAIAAGVLALFTASMVGLGFLISMAPQITAGLAAIAGTILTLSISLSGFALTVALVEAAGALLVGVFVLLINSIRSFLSDANNMASGISIIGSAISATINNISDSIGNGILSISMKVASGIQIISATISVGILQISSAIGNGIRIIIVTVLGFGSSMKEAGNSLFTNFKEGLSSKISELTKFPKDVISTITNGLGEKGKIKDAGIKMGANLVEGFRNSTGWHSPPKFVTNFLDDCGITLEGMGDSVFSDAGNSMGSSLSNAFNSSSDGMFSSLLSEAKGRIGEFSNLGGLLGGAVGGSFMNELNRKLKYATNNVEKNWKIWENTVKNSTAVHINSASDYAKYQEKMKKATEDVGDEIEETSVAMDNYSESTDKAGKSAKETKDKFESLSETIENQMNIFEEFNAETDLTGQQLLKNMKSQLDGVANWTKELVALSARGIDRGLYDKLAEMGPNGYKYVHAFTQMTKEELAKANLYYATSLIFPAAGSMNILSSYANAGDMAAKGFINGINSEDFKSEAHKVAMKTLSGLEEALDINSPSRKTYADGMYTALGLKNGITDYQGQVWNRATSMAQILLAKVKSELSQDKFVKIGENVTRGLEIGINNRSFSVFTTMENMCKSVVNGAKKIFDTHSPSKVFDEIGGNLDDGLAGGISRRSNSLLRTAKDVFGAVIEAADLDVESDPVIRPVMDLSDIKNGISQLESIFDSKVYSFNSDIIPSSYDPSSYMSSTNMSVESSNKDVVSAISSLREDVNKLNVSMSNMKMVLDSGTLVGEIAAPIDAALGQRAVYAGRGN